MTKIVIALESKSAANPAAQKQKAKLAELKTALLEVEKKIGKPETLKVRDRIKAQIAELAKKIREAPSARETPDLRPVNEKVPQSKHEHKPGESLSEPPASMLREKKSLAKKFATANAQLAYSKDYITLMPNVDVHIEVGNKYYRVRVVEGMYVANKVKNKYGLGGAVFSKTVSAKSPKELISLLS